MFINAPWAFFYELVGSIFSLFPLNLFFLITSCSLPSQFTWKRFHFKNLHLRFQTLNTPRVLCICVVSFKNLHPKFEALNTPRVSSICIVSFRQTESFKNPKFEAPTHTESFEHLLERCKYSDWEFADAVPNLFIGKSRQLTKPTFQLLCLESWSPINDVTIKVSHLEFADVFIRFLEWRALIAHTPPASDLHADLSLSGMWILIKFKTFQNIEIFIVYRLLFHPFCQLVGSGMQMPFPLWGDTSFKVSTRR